MSPGAEPAIEALARVEAAPAIDFFAAARENAFFGQTLAMALAQGAQTGAILNGELVANFEARIADRAGRRFAVAVGSCTDALFFALSAHGIGPGDEVLMPAFSFVASASAVLRTGAQPVFVDILPADTIDSGGPFSMDLDRAADLVSPRTRAVLHVSLFGGLSDPRPAEAFADRHRLVLIEDAAQSFGARFGRRLAGGTGDASAFSFDRNKPLAGLGTGGAVVTDNPDVAREVGALRWHGHGQRTLSRIGYNSQLTEANAAVLGLKLDAGERFADIRRGIARRYDAAFRDLPVEVPVWRDEVLHARHKYVIQTPRRDALRTALSAQGIPTMRHYHTTLAEQCGQMLAQPPAPCPVADRATREAISLPIHAFLDEADITRIISGVASFFR